MRIRFCALAALALLAACGGPVTTPGGNHSPAVYSHVDYIAGRGAMLLELHNVPTGEGMEDWVTRNFSGPVGLRYVTFTRMPEQAVTPSLRVVLAFSPAVNASPAQLCEGRVPTEAASGTGRITAMAAFCHQEQPLSDIGGRVEAQPGAEEESLRSLLGQMRRGLLEDRTERQLIFLPGR
ncbi:hypothetical protein [Telmatospirillum sp. J64-1]|uniref:hypothetical protein n=1 Tax=Telmatospirillum sp. J64-1 TaxID=2502183 RepID=UPI00115D2A06|nr:hypothetical protein [Telmatospirillum sp. J64-1]